jgi:hypothetical protein
MKEHKLSSSGRIIGLEIGPEYWDKTAAKYPEYEELYRSLVPAYGKAATPHGELLRCASCIYRDIYNNGGSNLGCSLKPAVDVLVSYFPKFQEYKSLKEPTRQTLQRFVEGSATHRQNDTVMDLVVDFVGTEELSFMYR